MSAGNFMGRRMAWTAQPDEAAQKALAELAMLEGVWHGDGVGPYGPTNRPVATAASNRRARTPQH
jgi:hypothetical protein